MEQRSEEWFEARRGKITSSMISAVTAKGRGSAESTTRRNYRMQLACERLGGSLKTDGYVSAAMQRGIDLEPIAQGMYEGRTGAWIQETSFSVSDKYPFLGASADGLVGDDGVLEVKCPEIAAHLDYVVSGKIPEDYRKQMMVECIVYNRPWCDFVSYNEQVPPDLSMLVIRFMPTQDELDALLEQIHTFEGEVCQLVEQLEGIISARRAA